MLKHLNPHTVANDVRMRATAFKGTFLLVEGRSDQKLYVKFVDPANAQVLPCKERSDALAAINILNSDGFNRAVAIVDSDFDRIEGVAPAFDNVFYTDGHDAEMMMLACHQAYSAVLAEFASPDKLAAWQAAAGKPLLANVIDEATKIGALMLHSKRSNANFKFKELRFAEFTDDTSLQINEGQLLQHVLNRSNRPYTPRAPILQAVTSISSSGYNVRDLARGHDVLDLFGFALRGAVGSCDQLESSGRNLEAYLRVAYPIECFSQTTLYGNIQKWAQSHGNMPIFS